MRDHGGKDANAESMSVCVGFGACTECSSRALAPRRSFSSPAKHVRLHNAYPHWRTPSVRTSACIPSKAEEVPLMGASPRLTQKTAVFYFAHSRCQHFRTLPFFFCLNLSCGVSIPLQLWHMVLLAIFSVLFDMHACSQKKDRRYIFFLTI